MKVAAIIVTRGDQPEGIRDISASLPSEWELLVWNNGATRLTRSDSDDAAFFEVPDLSVYGRYAAIEYTDAELIYVQDDDCVVSDPQAIVSRWHDALGREWDHTLIPGVVCNMPPEFRHDFYEDHALVGFGACFHRDAPARAFSKFLKAQGATMDYRETLQSLAMAEHFGFVAEGNFFRTCDIVFTGLTPRVLVDVPKENLPWANAPDRMWMQPAHQAERTRMLELVKNVRDGKEA